MDPSPHKRQVRWFFAGFLVTIGVLDVVETLLAKHPPGDRLLEGIFPLQLVHAGRTATVLAGLALILLARGVSRGKRVAWLVTCLVLAASLLFHLLKNLDVESAVISFWVLLGLWWFRAFFQADSDPVAVRRGLATIGVGIALYLAYAFAGSLLLSDQLSGGFQPVKTLNHLTGSALAGLAAHYDPLTDRASWFLESLPAVAGALLLIGLILLLRPVVLRAAAPGEGDAAFRELLESHGHNPVSWLALARRERFWAEPDLAVSYELSGRVAIALGDPVGPPERAPGAVRAFLAFCERHDWVAAFYQAERADLYRQAGFELLPIGSDAVLPVTEPDLSGKERHDLRYAVRRCDREGVRFLVLPGPQALETHGDELRAVSAGWLQTGKGPEMRFSLGTLETLRDPSTVAVLAVAAGGGLLAFCSWLPVPARQGWALDLMRRRPDALNGVVEALIVHSLEEAHRRGLRQLSLGVAPLSLSGFSAALRGGLFGRLYGRLDRLRAARTLTRFKAKFSPSWEPRYLAVPDRAALPEVLAALLAAHLPPPLRLLAGAARAAVASVPAFSRIGRRYWPV